MKSSGGTTEALINVRILPINSDPTMPDSDGDGFLDSNIKTDKTGYNMISDPNPLETNKIDSYTVDRINTLHPKVRTLFFAFVVEASLYYPIHVVRIAESYRTPEKQASDYKIGRTILYDEDGNPLTPVTWTLNSYHNYGFAIDLAFIKPDGNPDYDTPNLYDRLQGLYTKYNLEWGGVWSDENKDPPHYQMTFGYNTTKLLEMHNNHQVDSEGYVLI
jgi:hypothetical protein